MQTQVSPNKIRPAYKTNLTSVFLALLISPIFLIFIYWNGMYFEDSFYNGAIYIFLYIIFLSIVLLMKKFSIIKLRPVDYFIAALAITYFISLMNAASFETALHGAVRNITYALVFFAVSWTVSYQEDNRKLFIDILVLSGMFVSVFALSTGFGTLTKNGAVYAPEASRRLASVFEYPNTLAGYLVVILMLVMGRFLMTKNKASRIYYANGLYLMLVTLLATFSRGGWLWFGLLAAASLLLYRGDLRAKFLSGLFLAGIPVAITISPILQAIRSINEMKGWSFVLVGMVITGLSTYFYGKFEDRITRFYSTKTKQVWTMIVVLIGIALGVILMGGFIPQEIIVRLKSLNFENFSVVQRSTFYLNGLSAFKDSPIIGQGADTWKSTFQYYQSYPYWSQQAHSFIIDLLMDTGLLGVSLMIAILFITVRSWKRQIAYVQTEQQILLNSVILAIVALLGHAAIDFDMSFAIFGLLLWVLFALVSEPIKNEILTEKVFTTNKMKNKWIFITASVLSLAGIIYPVTSILAKQYEREAAAKLTQPSEAAALYQKATRVTPFKAKDWLRIAETQEKLLKKTNEQAYATLIKQNALEAAKRDPKDPEILMKSALLAARYGGGTEALDVSRNAWIYGKYTMAYSEQYMFLLKSAGDFYQGKDPVNAKMNYENVLKVFASVQDKVEGFKSLNPVLRLERPYHISDTMKQLAAESAVKLREYQEALDILNIKSKDKPKKEFTDRLAVLRYVASSKLGKPENPSEFSKVIKSDPGLLPYYQSLMK